MIRILYFLYAVFALGILLSCAKRKLPQPQEEILAKIGDKTISVDEFIRRAEYTIRPPYCRGDNNLDKKIVINSLIAEKLMATEAGDTNKFINSAPIKAQLRGRKEQAMRQALYEIEALVKVKLDTSRLAKIYQVAGRKYKLAYFNLSDSSLAQRMSREMKVDEKPFEDIYFELSGQDSIPQREVEWSATEQDVLMDSLFSGPLAKNQVVGPVRIDSHHFLLMKVNGWLDHLALTQTAVQQRWSDITDKYREREAVKLYDSYIRKVMKGKTLEFYPTTFIKIGNLLGPIYFPTEKEKQEMLKKSIWEQDENLEKHKDLLTQIEAIYQEPLFKVNNQVWTVKDFADELAVHPLVFRDKKMKKGDFGQQLQYAIADMIRDKYLTQEAYKRGYDKINVIQRNVSMWQDNFSYQYYKSRFLQGAAPDSLTAKQPMLVIEKYLNPQVERLQKKYSNLIEVNVEVFNKIKLTRIDMNVLQQNVPFPVAVPSFPLVTTDNVLDYGKKVEQ